MHINEQFENLVQEKYKEAKNAQVDTIILDKKVLGGITLFINTKPAFCMAEFAADEDKIYIGANEITSTS